MSNAVSLRYIKGFGNDGNGKYSKNTLPHYFVELTANHLSNFEVLNSLCLLNNYESLLFFIECQLDQLFSKHVGNSTKRSIMVPPYDIFLVILTLCTVSSSNNDEILRVNDPYNMTRMPLNKRAAKIMKSYIYLLKRFDIKTYNQYDLELLRCQLFLVIDSIFPLDVSMLNGNSVQRFTATIQVSNANDNIQTVFINPYESYTNCLNEQKVVLGNMLIDLKFRQRGEFINMVLFTLFFAIDETEKNYSFYLSSQEVWTPILNVILDILILRQRYFITNEIVGNSKSRTNKMSASQYTQRLSISPVAEFFKKFDSSSFARRFSEYIFVNCSQITQELNDMSEFGIVPVYNKETNLSNTFIKRIKYPKSYSFKTSMQLRRRIIKMCFLLLGSIPKNHSLVSPRMTTDVVIKTLSMRLGEISDPVQFMAFFNIDHIFKDLVYLPLLAEATLNEIIENNVHLFLKSDNDGKFNSTKTSTFVETRFDVKRRKLNSEPVKIDLLNKLGSHSSFLEECISILAGINIRMKSTCIAKQDVYETNILKDKEQAEYNAILKCGICIITLFKFHVSVVDGHHHNPPAPKFHSFFNEIKEFDSGCHRIAILFKFPTSNIPSMLEIANDMNLKLNKKS